MSLEKVEKTKEVISGKLTVSVTSEKKQRAWEQIFQAVNSVARVQRSPEELRRKLKDLRTYVKSKSADGTPSIEGTG